MLGKQAEEGKKIGFGWLWLVAKTLAVRQNTRQLPV